MEQPAVRETNQPSRDPGDMTVNSRAGRGYRPIADYAMVGDAQSGALIASDGGVDWLCLPHFDSPAILCRLLDADRGGFLAITPAANPISMTRSYRPASNVLDTTFNLPNGGVTITDAMPFADGDPTPPLDGIWGGHGRHRLIRLVTATKAPATIYLTARIAFDFAATPARIDLLPGRGAILDDGAGRFLALRWRGSLIIDDDGVLRGEMPLDRDESTVCVLGWARDQEDALRILDKRNWERQVAETDSAWREWASHCHADGPFAEAILRSALTLKMMTFEPSGAVIAALTTSLPEEIGGVRNWDYRYCWLRDATFTLYALLLVGDRMAAAAFWRWIERTCVPSGAANLQVMYGINGQRDLPERTLDHLSGYRDSRPVRVGNAAADQCQLDIYGELLDAFWFYFQQGRREDSPPIDRGVWELMRDVADHICEVWRFPDQGLWEVRSGPRHFVYSKVMCWVGLDRAIRLCELDEFDAEPSRWIGERDALMEEILARGFNPAINSFTMAYDSSDLDAALLRLPLVGFLPAADARIVGTIDRIQAELRGKFIDRDFHRECRLAQAIAANRPGRHGVGINRIGVDLLGWASVNRQRFATGVV